MVLLSKPVERINSMSVFMEFSVESNIARIAAYLSYGVAFF